MPGWRRLLSRGRCVEGAAIIEFAVSSAVLFAVMIGIIEMCFALYNYHVANYAARQATRWAIVRGSTSCTNTPNLTDCDATTAEIQSFVKNLGISMVNSANTTVNVTWLSPSGTTPTTWSTCSTGTCNAPGNQVQVQVIYTYPLHIPWVSSQTLSPNSTSTMVIAQ
jgi:Flp pilus assembly protein TadG